MSGVASRRIISPGSTWLSAGADGVLAERSLSVLPVVWFFDGFP
jgi:hypothetical protein